MFQKCFNTVWAGLRSSISGVNDGANPAIINYPQRMLNVVTNILTSLFCLAYATDFMTQLLHALTTLHDGGQLSRYQRRSHATCATVLLCGSLVHQRKLAASQILVQAWAHIIWQFDIPFLNSSPTTQMAQVGHRRTKLSSVGPGSIIC